MCVLTGWWDYRVAFAVGYWWVFFVAMPWAGGYRIEEEADVLGDGTGVTRLVRVKEA